ncbi:MAG: SRPBCC domain-containing protein [SAR202 cluster bacterium]|nr:SRPBCC domain-containing protein [SAR202 cluster bacterium]
MKIEGSYDFDAPRQDVWNALRSPEFLSSCIPGAEEFRSVGPDSYDLTVAMHVAGFAGSASAKIAMADQVEPESYRLTIEGNGVGVGVKGEGALEFTEIDSARTRVDVDGNAKVSGFAARLSQPLLGGAAKLMMNDFFGRMKTKLENG